MTTLDLFTATGVLHEMPRRRRRWRAVAEFVLTAIGVGLAGAVIAIGLAW